MAHDAEDTRDADPALDPSANYDYRGGPDNRADLVAALEARVEGDVRFDSYTRELYATDASAYEELPIGVVSPVPTRGSPSSPEAPAPVSPGKRSTRPSCSTSNDTWTLYSR
jgi:hypothetical protein